MAGATGMSAGAATRGPAPGIAGGFVRAEVAGLLRAWHACRGDRAGTGDFRVWLAAHEVKARRARAAGARPVLGLAELAKLGGVRERRAGEAVRRLRRAGLLTWEPAEGRVEPIAPGPKADGTDDVDATVAASIPGRGGMLAIPRRMLRFLAAGARPALIATALGALLRCVSRRRSGWGSRGRFQASWVASAFGVDARRVKEARAELIAIGWLAAEGDAADQWAWNRWGRAYRIDLSWSAQAPASPAAPDADCHPSPADPGRRSAPPDLDPAPLREETNPEPADGGPDGSRIWRVEADRINPNRTNPTFPVAQSAPTSAQPGPASPRPNLRDVRAADLADPARVAELHRQAVALGWSTQAEADRLRFGAAAAHARAVGRSNPPGLFRAIVQHRRWGLLTQSDEDRARCNRAPDSPTGPRPPRTASSMNPPEGPTPLAAILSRLGHVPTSSGSPRFHPAELRTGDGVSVRPMANKN